MSIEQYTEDISASEPVRKIYADSVSNAVAVLRVAAKLRREKLVTPERMAAGREEFRAEYAHMLGIDVCRDVFGSGAPELLRTYLGEDELTTVERVLFNLCDGITFTGLLLTPKQRSAKAPLAVMQHGGGGSPQLCCDLLGPNNYGGVARRMLERGVVVFAPQMLLWNFNVPADGGNIPSYTTRYDRRGSDNELKQCGVSIAGLEIYEISRALDVLLELPFVDHTRVGMCGLSYGGFYTLYTMAYETRIKSGWSAAFFNDRTKYCWPDFVWKDSCGRFLDTEVAGLCAPRKLWIDVGADDAVFDNGETAELFPRVKEFFAAAGVPGNIHCNRWPGGHRFSTDDGAFDSFLEGFGAYV
ncbi:MAG: hypothetical protein IJ493_07095 [Clostridia bacterium]|nr:hypothetical protein [Clostridia bacterium]